MARQIYLFERWVWSSRETLPAPDGNTINRFVVEAYTYQPNSMLVPRIFDDGPSLCFVEFTPDKYAAAMQDHRIVILNSVHSREPIRTTVTKHQQRFGAKSLAKQVAKRLDLHGVDAQSNVHDLLVQMHHAFDDEPGYLPRH